MAPISPEDWHRLEPLFDAALDLPDDQREAWLLAQKGLSAADLATLRDLLAAEGQTADHLEQPLPLAAARLLDASLHDPLLGATLGPFRIVEEIGRGGMGVVYLARRSDGDFEQDVVIKVLRLGVDSEDTRRRFLQERQILARLDHPGIVGLLDGGFTPDGRPYIVMHRVIGQRIDAWCDSRRLDIRSRVRLFLGVLEAVDYAHRNLVIHRDLKPSNVWVDEEGKVHLLDFGIAKITEEDSSGPAVTVTRQRVMTPEYASPEQVRQTSITTASDVYQLGVLLYQLLTGRYPYDLSDRSPLEVEHQICDTVPVPPSRAVADTGTGTDDSTLANRDATAAGIRRILRGDLDVILGKALRKEPARRYLSARELRADLIRWLSGDRIMARPDSLGYQLRRFVRRHTLGASLAATLIVSSLGFTLYHVDRITRERDIARQEAEQRKEVADFLVGLLQVPDPTTSAGREVTARELLEVSVPRIETDLSNIETRIRIYQVVGQVAANLGLYDQAGPALAQVVRHTAAMHGEVSLETARAKLELAELYRSSRNYNEAAGSAESALAIRRHLLPSDDVEVGRALKIVAIIHRDQRKYEQAEAELREAIHILEASVPAADPTRTTLTVDLAYVLRTVGKAAEAESLYSAAIPVMRAQPAEFQTVLPSTLNNLGYLLKQRGDWAGAEACYREAITRNESIYGEAHPSTLLFRNNLASVLQQQGKLDETEQELQTCIALQEHLNGADHWRAAGAHRVLGYFRFMIGDLDNAEPELRHCYEVFGRVLGPDHVWTAGAGMQLATCLYAQGSTPEAERIMTAAFPILDSAHGRADQTVQAWLEGTVTNFDRAADDPWRQRLAALIGPGTSRE